MIQEQLAFLPEFLPDYRPFPPAKERTAWQGLPLRAKQRFLQAGEAALQTPIAPLPLSLWLDFTHTGRRTPWETAYFSRRARLCALVSAECVEHKGRFLDAIADTVLSSCVVFIKNQTFLCHSYTANFSSSALSVLSI